ncbi:amidohydrolase family protein [Acinetobacter baumannii]|uniref:amidohydrolase family protein n=1 Tax=Acinetobacter baumannii TaxID=470 RepID=UPI00201C32F4|nr:amidohydrolase family protein [Acinetobacter baumannii]MCL6175867.1 amidohydrolase family protein [Acinetobacter baumannii]MCL6179195.1 amidohydrolase family protein [Acinetobacter baumannii]MCL6186104.1 amidohydrolase family protein [Acinetobacter baumannii]MCL6206769.1 amidohydrolase family protein [Acinetobacter baumannii]MCL6210669.1 amidohydrolase family protein [Acinetobacter baumannii]
MNRILLRGSTVITMAQDRPDFERIDILVENGRITRMEPMLEIPDVEVFDFTGRILIPGLVNAHLHSWQAALRSVGADWTLLEYLAQAHAGLAQHYTPEDMRIAARACALNQINSGTTTLGDWCHNVQTKEHADSTIQGLIESGIRGVFLHGMPHKFRQSEHPMQEVDRLLRGPIAAHDLLTLGIAIPGPQYSKKEIALADFRGARERDIIVSMHQSGGKPGEAWEAVRNANLIGPKTNIVHGNEIPDDWLKIFVDAGASFTSTPENELGQGHGFPITGRLLSYGSAPSLGTDVDTVLSGEILTAARIALAQQRGLDHEQQRQTTGLFSPKPTISSKQALSWATTEGARALGLSDRIGRLEVGMQADIVVIDAQAINLWPAHDPIATALQASIANIEAVMIAGQWRKRDYKLLDASLNLVKEQLYESGQRLVGVMQSQTMMARLRNKVINHVVHRTLIKQSRS